MRHSTPLPGEPAPALGFTTLGGRAVDLAAERPRNFSVIVFYRGVHCPICRRQMESLDGRLADFAAAGIAVHAVSMDDRARAQRQRDEWAIDNIDIGYGLSEASARDWGLFISKKEKDGEPERFAEPGIAVVRPDGTLYALFLQTVPFTRPAFDELLAGLTFVLEKNYPIRGGVPA